MALDPTARANFYLLSKSCKSSIPFGRCRGSIEARFQGLNFVNLSPASHLYEACPKERSVELLSIAQAICQTPLNFSSGSTVGQTMSKQLTVARQGKGFHVSVVYARGRDLVPACGAAAGENTQSLTDAANRSARMRAHRSPRR